MTYSEKKARLSKIYERKEWLYPGPPTVEWMAEELEKAWAALAFYADTEGGEYDYSYDMPSNVQADAGKRAREALEK